MTRASATVIFAAGLACAACAGKLPETRYYQLSAAGPGQLSAAGPGQLSPSGPGQLSAAAPGQLSAAGPGQLSPSGPGQLSAAGPGQLSAAGPAASAAPALRGDGLLVLETPTTDAAYDDDRIVYRTTPFRLDYYQYHRWSSAPGTMIGNYLEQAFEASGKFRAVVRDATPDAPVVLTGRVVAIEEVDRSRTEWMGRIALELLLTDARTGEALWAQQLEETEPLRRQSPEGLAAALSLAMARIAARVVPVVSGLAERQAQLHADRPTTTATRAPR